MISISNQDYYAEHFISPDTGWIAGTSWNGTQYIAVILTTKNGGTDWVSLNVQAEGILKGIYFIDDLQGWACGKDGLIVHTSDGGAHWDKQDSHTYFDLNDIFFSDSQHGWAAGERGILLYTENGGASWEAQSSGTDKNLQALCFIETGTGWACGSFGSLVKTGLYGYDLVPQPLLPMNGDIATARVNIFVWHQLHPQSPVQLQVALSSDFILPELDETLFPDSVYTPPKLLSGTRYYWRLRAVYNGKPSAWSSVFTFETEGTWVRQPSPLQTNLNSVFFFDASRGYAVGDSGTLLSTQNSGASWQISSMPVDVNLNTIYFSDEMNGWIAGANGTLLHSQDGGAHWQTVHTGAAQPLRTICFRNAELGWAGGGDGSGALLLKTGDGGNSWQPESINGLSQINQIYFLNGLEGWIVGSGASFNAARSVDGGNSWQMFSVGGNETIYSIHFQDTNHGYLTAASGLLYTTTDGGNTWNPVSLTTENDLKAFALPNPHTMLVLGDGIHISGDSGQSWTTSLAASAYSLNDFFFADSVTGWLVGDQGLILKTSSAGLPLSMEEDKRAPIVREFELSQNYPNPFNPTTRIKYQVARQTDVQLIVYNILGQKVRTLVNGREQAGWHTVSFDASGLASGIYFYRLQMGNGTALTRKMVLLR